MTKRLVNMGIFIACTVLLCGPASAGTIERVSVSTAGAEANASSNLSSINADGRFVVFESSASNLVAGDTNGAWDVFVHDRNTGATERVSVNSTEGQANNSSINPAISPDGRFVAFESTATNLVPGDANGTTDVFVRDRQAGTTERISVNSSEIQGNSYSFKAVLSADGRFVAFASNATNLAANDTNGIWDIFVRDRQTGTTERVSVDDAGFLYQESPAINADGRFVAYVAETADVANVLVRDRQTETTEAVSVDSNEVGGNDHSFEPVLSADGRFVVFNSRASNLVPGDTNDLGDVFVRDRQMGATERVSVDSSESQLNYGSWSGSINADGRFVAFEAYPGNLPDGQIYVRDRLDGTTEKVSVNINGTQSNDHSGTPSISADARFVVFRSDSTNLVDGDTNHATDIFVRDLRIQDDLLVDFGSQGLWVRLNNLAWLKANGLSPIAIATADLNGDGRDEAIASFTGRGLLARFNLTTWTRLHGTVPKHFIAGDFDGSGRADVAADFGSIGIWVRYNNVGAWVKRHSWTSEDLAVVDIDGDGKNELIADFGSRGLWVRYNDINWSGLHGRSPLHIATGDLDGSGEGDVIVDFGDLGLWARFNNASWVKLHSWAVEGLATGDLDSNDEDELLVDFGSRGLYARYNNTTWIKLHSQSPRNIVTADLDGSGRDEAIASFPGLGLFARYNNAGAWQRIHTWAEEAIAAGSFD